MGAEEGKNLLELRADVITWLAEATWGLQCLSEPGSIARTRRIMALLDKAKATTEEILGAIEGTKEERRRWAMMGLEEYDEEDWRGYDE